jgi:heptose I phosphotransferase
MPHTAQDQRDVWIDEEFAPLLGSAGLVDFDSFMETERGRCLRALEDRENWRLDVPHADGRASGMYLKKHHVRSWQWWLRARLGRPARRSPGRVEARNIVRLDRSGVAAMRLVAFGDRLHADGLLESFVLTEELVGFTQLDHLLRRRFPERHASTKRDAVLSGLIEQIANVAARFHQAGFNHRDFYCCHFFIRETEDRDFEVRLIDLQRVERRRWLRWRWIVKDLAQLAYSAPRERIGPTARMAFIKHYLGVRKLRPVDKRLIRAVLAKQIQMEQHLGPHP